MNITGTMLHYYSVCRRKLWYFLKGINMEHNSEYVKLGNLIEEEYYKSEDKNLMIDEKINVDFIENWETVHEVKKSDKLEELFVWQIKYYIYILKKYGLEIEAGTIDYPSIRKRTKVSLEEADIEKLENMIREIEEIKHSSKAPNKTSKLYCKKCAYYDLCYI